MFGGQELSFDQQILILGKLYLPPQSQPQIFNQVKNLCWMTYRSDFAPLLNKQKYRSVNSHLTTDNGWGCLIRTTQMMLATAIQNTNNFMTKKETLTLFLDIDDPKHPFSIHNFCRVAYDQSKKEPGEWYGGSEAAIIASVSFLIFQKLNTELKPFVNFEVMVAGQEGIIPQKVYNLSQAVCTCDHMHESDEYVLIDFEERKSSQFKFVDKVVVE